MEKKVLLIDDEASLRRSVSLGLMQKGYQTEPCENGMKALQTLETFKKKRIPLGCAIVDIRLPDIDGLKLLKVIKFNYPQLPVIIITGYGSEEVAEEARTADAYLEKPFTTDDLAKTLEEMEAPTAEAAAAEPSPKPSVATAESTSAYALVSLDNSANFLNIYRKLYFHHNVLYCDAIRGDYDLVLLLQASTPDRIREVAEKELKAMEGVAEISLLTVDAPMFGEHVINIMSSVDRALGRDKEENVVATNQAVRPRISSYVMLEIEKEKMEGIYPSLYFNDRVVNCDYTDGRFNIVLLMKGTSFSEIESIIRNRFKTINGVLRIKEYSIITLFET
jgi:CheY-like chemotaxis protein